MKNFENVSLELITFVKDDVITTSGISENTLFSLAEGEYDFNGVFKPMGLDN